MSIIYAGISVCGASAATAVQSAIHASKDDLAAVVTVITLFTVIQMIALPYLIQVLDLPSKVAGAWIGGSIDATGECKDMHYRDTSLVQRVW